MSTEAECPNCCKKYKKRGNLLRHLRMSFDCSVGEPWQCMQCQRYFNCKKNLENHVRQRHAYQCNLDVAAVRLIQARRPDHLLGLAPERGEIFPDAEVLTRTNEHQEINRVLQNLNDNGNLLVLIIDRNQPVSSNPYNSQRSEHNHTAVSQSNERTQEMQMDVNQNNVGQINKRSFSQIQENQEDTIPVNEITQQYQNISKSDQIQESISNNHENVTPVTKSTQEYTLPITVKSEIVEDNREDETQNGEGTILSITKESEILQDYFKSEIPSSEISEYSLNRAFLMPNKISDTQESNLQNTAASVKIENDKLESEVNATNDEGFYFIRNEEPPNSKRLKLSIIKHQSNDVPMESINSVTQSSIKQECPSERIEDNQFISHLSEKSERVFTSNEFLQLSQLLDEDEIDDDDDMPRVSHVINDQHCDQSNNISSSQYSSTIYDSLSQSFIDDICVLDSDLNIFRTVLLGNDQKDNINVDVFLKRLKKTFFDIIEDSLKQHKKLKLNFELIVDFAVCDDNDIFDIQTQSFETNLADHHLGDDIHLFINSVYKAMLHRLELDMAPNTAIIEIKHLEINIAHHLPQISVKQNLF